MIILLRESSLSMSFNSAETENFETGYHCKRGSLEGIKRAILWSFIQLERDFQKSTQYNPAL